MQHSELGAENTNEVVSESFLQQLISLETFANYVYRLNVNSITLSSHCNLRVSKSLSSRRLIREHPMPFFLIGLQLIKMMIFLMESLYFIL